jgi:hypothetical protein
MARKQKSAAAAVAKEPVLGAPAAAAAPMSMVDELTEKLEAAKAGRESRRVASGSKPRPNVVYTLLKQPPRWHSTPQVAQLQQVLFDPAVMQKYGVDKKDPKTGKITRVAEIPEPDVFDLVAAGAARGAIRTRQSPVRLLQYYRSTLLNADCLRWA